MEPSQPCANLTHCFISVSHTGFTVLLSSSGASVFFVEELGSYLLVFKDYSGSLLGSHSWGPGEIIQFQDGILPSGMQCLHTSPLRYLPGPSSETFLYTRALAFSFCSRKLGSRSVRRQEENSYPLQSFYISPNHCCQPIIIIHYTHF